MSFENIRRQPAIRDVINIYIGPKVLLKSSWSTGSIDERSQEKKGSLNPLSCSRNDLKHLINVKLSSSWIFG